MTQPKIREGGSGKEMDRTKTDGGSGVAVEGKNRRREQEHAGGRDSVTAQAEMQECETEGVARFVTHKIRAPPSLYLYL